MKFSTNPKPKDDPEKSTKELKKPKRSTSVKSKSTESEPVIEKAGRSRRKVKADEKTPVHKIDEVKEEVVPPKKAEYKLYTLKFNSPILPFAKFPLTQNKYIQDFLRKFDEDKEKIAKVIGVHFLNNLNSNAPETVGIEIEITMRNNVTIVESNSNKRYRIKSYDEVSNFCIAEDYEDNLIV